MNAVNSQAPGAPGRTPVHTRKVTTDIFLRDDGLWDVECRVQDCKHFAHLQAERGLIPALSPYHDIAVTLTVNDALTIVSATAAMDSAPFLECGAAADPISRLVGVILGRGWRKAIDEAIGQTRGCTHMREMLYSAATPAIQGILAYRDQVAGKPSPLPQSEVTEPPRAIGGCMSWREDGPVVLRRYPRYFKAK